MANASLPKAILVIDDDSTVGQAIEGPLGKQYKIEVCNSQDLETATYQFNNQDFDVVFMELEFEPLHGLALIQKFRESDSVDKRATAFVLMSGKTRPPTDESLLKELMDIEVITKPFSMVNILPFLSRGMTIKQKLLKYEKFRAKCLELHVAGRTTDAINHVKENITVLGTRGIKLCCELYEKGELFEEGLAFITPLSDGEPGNVVYAYLRGRFLRLLGRFKEAQKFLEEAHTSSPYNLHRLEDMGELYLGLKDVKKAVENVTTLVKLNPDAESLKFYWFDRLEAEGYSDEARKFCQQTTKPMEVIRYYNNKGVELSKKGDFLGAIEQYRKALKLYPKFKENYRVHYNIALAYIKIKNKVSYQSAAESLEAALVVKKDFDKARNTLASVQKALGKKAS